MGITINLLRKLRFNQRGISNVIVMVLSLVILVTIVSNIILWSYQMNQLDWEKMHENFNIISVAPSDHSSWFSTRQEYVVSEGSQSSGTFSDTQLVDDSFETFVESAQLEIEGSFSIDIVTFPLERIQTVESQMRYKANSTEEKLYIKAYNWSSSVYEDQGFNTTMGHVPSTEWDNYSLNFSDQWQNYVHVNGTVKLKVIDETPDVNQTTIDIDFLAIRAVIEGAEFQFQNNGPSTLNLVSIWINNQTLHQRYDLDVFLNSAETVFYFTSDIILPNEPFTVRVVTKRGNIAILS